jgi:hypothetical protein
MFFFFGSAGFRVRRAGAATQRERTTWFFHPHIFLSLSTCYTERGAHNLFPFRWMGFLKRARARAPSPQTLSLSPSRRRASQKNAAQKRQRAKQRGSLARPFFLLFFPRARIGARARRKGAQWPWRAQPAPSRVGCGAEGAQVPAGRSSPPKRRGGQREGAGPRDKDLLHDGRPTPSVSSLRWCRIIVSSSPSKRNKADAVVGPPRRPPLVPAARRGRCPARGRSSSPPPARRSSS